MAIRVKADTAGVRWEPIQNLAASKFMIEYEIESSVDSGPVKRDSFALDKTSITGATTLSELRTEIIDQIKTREGIA